MIQQFTQEAYEQMDLGDKIHNVACGIGSVGFYFWNDFQTSAIGPFDSYDSALAAEAQHRRSCPDWFRGDPVELKGT